MIPGTKVTKKTDGKLLKKGLVTLTECTETAVPVCDQAQITRLCRERVFFTVNCSYTR